ncbi:DNA-binding domain-containing protein [uncultured Parabacteroides sp.]|uniref:DNA-binding domain-containing protein n=1 Tax=uncultured Parabacteroides sp. TaxID=512312 RepID=UPI002590064D|nr:DNA-binding domain-containing protein [uncultured Parabacteroides sp.]
MQNTLKGWLADNTVTTDDKTDKILLLESAGNIGLEQIYKEMKEEDTGLKMETIVHVVTLFLRIVMRFVLNGYSVNTGLFRAVVQFVGTVKKGVWNPEENSIYVSFNQEKQLREAIAKTKVEILGTKANVMYILEVEDRKTGLKDGTATPGRNFFVRGSHLKVIGSDPAVGVTLTDSTGNVTKLVDDEVSINKPSELTLLLPAGLKDDTYTLTVCTQYSQSAQLLKEPRSVSTTITVGTPTGGGEDDRPVIE